MQQRLSVSEATALVKECMDEGLAPLWVEGEVSNFVAHSSGHFYFSLKDAGAQLRCVMFRSANRRLRFVPADGTHAASFGRIGVYARGGQYQLIVERLLPLGEGELQLAFEALKARLAAEGLFDPERKRRLPAFPRKIGVVTSPTGAAIRDIVRVLRRRWPPVQILLRPVRVQGEGAAEEIAAGIADFGRRGGVDLLIVGRGGGSLEDLWAFNEEITARAIAASAIPIISAVGHEIDHTIADLVADQRAPTPSTAAEIAVPDARECLTTAGRQWSRCRVAMDRKLGEVRLRLEAARTGRALISPLDRLRQESQRADELLQRSRQALERSLASLSERAAQVAARIEALAPIRVLDRGFALCFDAAGGLLNSVRGVEVGDAIRVELGQGGLRCRVESVEPSAAVIGDARATDERSGM